jgi:hypothetical protein
MQSFPEQLPYFPPGFQYRDYCLQSGKIDAIENKGKVPIALEHQNALRIGAERVNRTAVRSRIDRRNREPCSDQVLSCLCNSRPRENNSHTYHEDFDQPMHDVAPPAVW